jgi:AraC-like DNA-binding protein
LHVATSSFVFGQAVKASFHSNWQHKVFVIIVSRNWPKKIAEGPQEDWRTETLAAEAGVSPRSLSRLFRQELSASPSKFVERVRPTEMGNNRIRKSGFLNQNSLIKT